MRRSGLRTRTVTSITTSVLFLAVVACSGGAGSETSGSGSDATVSLECRDGRLLVGIAKAESGMASFFDVAGRRGLEVAIDQVNAEGGIKGCPLEIISGDTKSDPAVGAEVARSLIDQGAQILVVADDFDTGIAAARVGQSAGVLTLSTAASSTDFAPAVGDLFFSGGITTTELGLAQGEVALENSWMTTFQVIDPGLAYFTEQDDTYRRIYEAGGGKVTEVDRVDSLSGQSDFSSTISKIKRADPDVIQALAVFPAVGTFVRQLRAAGVDTPVVGNITLQTRELLDLLGAEHSNDIYYAAQVYFDGAGIDPETSPGITAFAEAYERKFGHFPEQANAPASYQVFIAVNAVLQQDDVVDAATAADALRAQTDVQVPGGTLQRWDNGYAIWNPVVVLLDGGKWSWIDSYSASDLRDRA